MREKKTQSVSEIKDRRSSRVKELNTKKAPVEYEEMDIEKLLNIAASKFNEDLEEDEEKEDANDEEDEEDEEEAEDEEEEEVEKKDSNLKVIEKMPSLQLKSGLENVSYFDMDSIHSIPKLKGTVTKTLFKSPDVKKVPKYYIC